MSAFVAAVIAAPLIGAGVSLIGGSKAAKGATAAAETSAGASRAASEATLQGQREQLEYLKEVDALPREYREQALTQLSETYLGPNGFQYPEGQLLDQAKNSEMFAMLREQGNEALLRSASATGGLRSGGTIEDLVENEQQALLRSYQEQQKQYDMGLQGVASLANLPLQTTNIADTMGSMARTEGAGIDASGRAIAAGQVASGQAWQQGFQGATTAFGTGVGGLLEAKGRGWI